MELFYYFAPEGTLFLLRNEGTGSVKEMDMEPLRSCPIPQDLNPYSCSSSNGKEQCARYCQMVVLGLRSQDVIRDVLALAVEEVNHLRDFGPYSLLPACTWQNENGSCWKKIVNEFGTCFTQNFEGDKLN